MALYSANTAHIQIYSLIYSIVYSVQYMQYNTAIFFSSSTTIVVWTVMFRCMTPCVLVYFYQTSASFFRILMTVYRIALCHNSEDGS